MHPDSALIEAIVAFLRSLGLEVLEGTVPADAFLPGIEILQGGLRYDPSRLVWPGDLLHEAGHLAVTPAAQRPALQDKVGPMEEGLHAGESESVAWSFAAAVAMGLDPALLFHEGGYRGRSQGLLLNFTMGVYPGVAGLESFGMAVRGARAGELGIPPYPHMRKWLRD